MPDGALDYIHSYEQAAQDLKYLEEKKEEAANRLKEMLKDCSMGTVADRTVKWVAITCDRLDEPKLRQEHEKLYKRYLKPRSYRRFSIQ